MRPTSKAIPDGGNFARWGDVDGDGIEDIVVSTHAGIVYWFRNTSTTSFSSTTAPTGQSLDLGGRVMALELADLNGDGTQEVIVGTGVRSQFECSPAADPTGHAACTRPERHHTRQ